MFLDEELEQIYSAEKGTKECAMHLLQACQKRYIEDCRPAQGYTVELIKRIDYSWQVFAKKHEEINNHGFRNFVLRDPNKSAKFKILLGW